jgi:D-3-phosphoglycerate dehydrogenase
MRILVADKLAEEGLEYLRQEGAAFDVKVGLKEDELASEVGKYDALIVRSGAKVTARVLENPGQLKAIARAGVGVDNIDLVAATERGVAVLNAPAGNTVSAAELTMALILAMVRRVSEADAAMRKGTWAKLQGVELRGRTLGLVGAGRIGGEVAKRCRAFGMYVIAYDPYLTDERAAELDVQRGTLDEVLEKGDIISLHVPLTDATKNMISTDALARVKKGAFLVNVARGGVVDEAALAKALESKHLAGAALDVYANEPLEKESPLLNAPNILLTPHLGASTSEAQDLVASEIAEAVRKALADGDLTTALNAPSIGGEALRALTPLFDLGKALGHLACALAPGGIQAVEVRYSGASDEALRPLTAYVLMGLLEDVLGKDQVNFVSAGHLANQRGIRVARTQLSQDADYTEHVELVVTAERGELRLAGALLGDTHPRIVRIDEYRVDIVPAGALIILKNNDVPGVIGRVGTVLGSHRINIAEYHQARLSKGGQALAAISVDGEVGEPVREALLQLPEISSAVVVRLAWNVT